MFCPVGYVSFEEIYGHIEELNRAALTQMTEEAFAKRGSGYTPPSQLMVSAGLIEEASNAQFARELMAEFLFHRLLELSPPLLCSDAGDVMKVHSNMFVHADRLDWIHLQWPLDKMSELSNYFSYNKSHGFDGISIRRRYCFFDGEIGIEKSRIIQRDFFIQQLTPWKIGATR